jgi:hypothetical protein
MFIKGLIGTLNRVIKGCPMMRKISLIAKYEIGKKSFKN